MWYETFGADRGKLNRAENIVKPILLHSFVQNIQIIILYSVYSLIKRKCECSHVYAKKNIVGAITA